MGIGVLEFQFLLNEHRYKPISGEVLSIGAQTTAITPDRALFFMDKFGIPRREGSTFSLDTETTLHSAGVKDHLTDRSLFSLFSDCKFLAADISDYEGAESVFDICGNVPNELKGRFDFVMDGGSLDNVFDPVAMMRNMAAMLKPGGRMFLTPWINSHHTAYVKLSPDWVMDYFAVNEFADAKVYVFLGPSHGGKPSMWRYEPAVNGGYLIPSIRAENTAQLFAIAEMGERSFIDKMAVQTHYRGRDTKPYVESAARFRASPRPDYMFPMLTQEKSYEASDRAAMLHMGTAG